MTRLSWKNILPLVLLSLPALALLWAVLQADALPDLDYWYTLSRLTTESGFSPDPAVWLTHSNEHFIPLSAAIYALNILVTGGSSTVLSLVAWLMAVAQAAAIIFLLPKSCTETSARKSLSYLLAGLFVFTPAAYHNWMRGMSGVCWVGANAFALLSLCAFERFRRSRSWGALLISLVLALAASLAYSTGLMVWPMLWLYSLTLLPAERRPVILYTVAGGLLAIVVAATFQRPAHHLPPSAAEPLRNFRFFFSMLGGTLSTERSWTVLAGLISFVIFVATVTWLARQRRIQETSALLALSLYPLFNGIVSSIFRVTKYSAASASRYATLPSVYLLAVVLLLCAAFSSRRPRVASLVLIVGVLIAIAPYWLFCPEYQKEFRRQELKAIASLSLKVGGFDWDLLRSFVMRQRGEFEAFLPRAKALQHVPFNESPEYCPQFGSKVNVLKGEERVIVVDDARTPTGSSIRYVGGRLKPRMPRGANCFVLADANGGVVGRVLRLGNGKRWGGYVLRDSDGALGLIEWPAARRLGVAHVPPRE